MEDSHLSSVSDGSKSFSSCYPQTEASEAQESTSSVSKDVQSSQVAPSSETCYPKSRSEAQESIHSQPTSDKVSEVQSSALPQDRSSQDDSHLCYPQSKALDLSLAPLQPQIDAVSQAPLQPSISADNTNDPLIGGGDHNLSFELKPVQGNHNFHFFLQQ